MAIAKEIIGRYPRPKSALIPLLHLAQEQDGYVTDEAMAHIAELLGVTPAEVYGTATFYEMFKFEPVGTYLVNVCTNISCQLIGGVGAARARRGDARRQGRRDDRRRHVHPRGRRVHRRVHRGARASRSTTATATRSPTPSFDQLIDDLRAGRLDDEIPPHGTLARVRQRDARRPLGRHAATRWRHGRGGCADERAPAERRQHPRAGHGAHRAEARHAAASTSPTATRSTATSAPAATTALRKALTA